MNLFNFLITNYFRIIKFSHYGSLHTKVCFLFRGDTASLLLNRCLTEWTEYSEVICSFKKVCFGTFVIESRRNPHILAISIFCELVSALWGLQPKILCWQTSIHKDYARLICNKICVKLVNLCIWTKNNMQRWPIFYWTIMGLWKLS